MSRLPGQDRVVLSAAEELVSLRQELEELKRSLLWGVTDPRGILGRAVLGATTSTFTAETDILTLPAITFPANRLIRLSAQGNVMSTVAADDAGLALKEGATALTNFGEAFEIRYASGTAAAHFHIGVLLVPSAGAHTYKLTCRRYLGTGSISVAGGGSSLGYTYLLCEDLGAS